VNSRFAIVAIVAISAALASASAGCASMPSHATIGFASASGAELTDRPFGLLRFTPGGRGQMVTGSSVKRHPSGDLVVAGVWTGKADVGLGAGGLANTMTSFVGRYSPSGRPRWVRWMSSSSMDGPRVAVDATGGVTVLATSRYAPRPFGTPEPACGEKSGCPFTPTIHVLSPEGEPRWSRAFPIADRREEMHPEHVVTDASGDVTVAGRFGVKGDVFVARYASASGTRRWFSRLRSSASAAHGLAALPNGDVVVTGYTTGEMRIDDAVASKQGTMTGYLACLAAADGTARWLDVVGPASTASIGMAVAGDAAGDVFLVSRSAFSDHASLAKLTGATGAPRWSRVLPTPPGQIRGAAIDLEQGGAPVVALQLTMGETAKAAALIVALPAEGGVPLWSRQLRTHSLRPDRRDEGQRVDASWSLEAVSMASLGPAEVVVTGWFTGRADLGGLRAEGPWARERRTCDIDDDYEACKEDWSERSMFVARIGR